MSPVTIQVYSSIECPYAYLMTYRLRQVLPQFEGRVQVTWRALSLEYINRQSYPKPLFDAERSLFEQIEPNLPWQPWSRPEWQWPVTHWPAFEALACAQAQGPEAALAMSWALRHAYFAESRTLSMRHELFELAGELERQSALDARRFEDDWDHGRFKNQVAAESFSGWRELHLEGSATLILPDGQRFTNPATGEIDFDEENYRLRSFTPYPGDPIEAYRQILDQAVPAGDEDSGLSSSER